MRASLLVDRRSRLGRACDQSDLNHDCPHCANGESSCNTFVIASAVWGAGFRAPIHFYRHKILRSTLS